MRLSVDIGRDEELRKEILRMVEREIKRLTGDEIRQLAQDHLQNVNVAAKVTSTIKDLLNKQLDFLIRGYGDVAVKQRMDEKMEQWLEDNFQKYFDKNCKGFIKEYMEDKVQSFQDFITVHEKTK